jgi:hypothetical protein
VFCKDVKLMEQDNKGRDSYRMRDKGQELRMSVLQGCKIDGQDNNGR